MEGIYSSHELQAIAYDNTGLNSYHAMNVFS